MIYDTAPVRLDGSQTVGEQKDAAKTTKDEFLRMLVTQLENQDPLQPQDASEFANQMTQFGILEQMFNMNESMESMIGSAEASLRMSAMQYVGKDVLVDGSRVTVEDGVGGTMRFNLHDDAKLAVISVMDSAGQVVAAEQIENMEAGEYDYPFDAKDIEGGNLPDGKYQFMVRALDDEQRPVLVDTRMQAHVDAVNFENGVPVLIVEGKRFGLDEIVEVKGDTKLD